MPRSRCQGRTTTIRPACDPRAGTWAAVIPPFAPILIRPGSRPDCRIAASSPRGILSRISKNRPRRHRLSGGVSGRETARAEGPESTLCGPSNVVSVEWIDPLHVPRQGSFLPAPCTTESFINSIDYFDRNVPRADAGIEVMCFPIRPPVHVSLLPC